MSIRVILTVLIIGGGIAIMYWLQPIYGGLPAALIGSLFFLFALALWTLPAASFQRGGQMDLTQRRLVYGCLGVGVGMMGGLAVAALVPRPFNWVVLGAAAVAATVWYYRK